ncbi:hypothetical protein NQ318_015318 [Aromia moschata]|uniref:CUB domain-containing protein n=1 Tax=Aromia moschata TaxID=1265417 RepID=A0AAV8XWJ6_9CUCU|nr:hypothetical protein NQ318_015318 [Aromia moschata]
MQGDLLKALVQFVPNRELVAVASYCERGKPLTPELIPCYINLSDPYQGLLSKDDTPKEIIAFHNKYGAAIDCLWSITVPVGMKIYLQFAKFTLDKPNDCDNNFVQVFSNKTNLASQEKMFCGSIADTVTSKTEKMFVRFFSYSFNDKMNFEANYTAYRDTATKELQEIENIENGAEDIDI